jgi:hypothetical protein
VSVEPVFYRLLPVHVTRRFIIASSSVALCTVLGTMFSGIIWHEEPFLKKKKKKTSIFLVLPRNLDIKLDRQVTSLCSTRYSLSSKSFRYSGGAKRAAMTVMRRCHAVRSENILIVDSCKVDISA